MPVVRPLWESDPVQYVVLWKFPALVAFRSEITRKHLSWSHEKWQSVIDESNKYRCDLQALPIEEFEKILKKARSDELDRLREFERLEEDNRVFNKPSAVADYTQWAAAAYWTTEEATALSLGRDPRIANWKVVQPYIHTSPFAKMYAARRDLIRRAEVMGQLYAQTIPSFFLAWVERMQLNVPDKLFSAVSALGLQVGDWKSLYEQERELLISVRLELEAERKKDASSEARPMVPATKSFALRERDSLLKLVIGMAVKGYSYDPTSNRSPIAKEIASDLALIGLSMDEDTVRKYLKESASLLPSNPAE